MAKTVLLRVGEEGAEWGLDGGKGCRTMIGKVFVGDVDGVTKGVSDKGGGFGSRKLSPEYSPNILFHPGDVGECGELSGKESLPQFGEMDGWVGGAKSNFSLDGELGREIGPGGRLGCSVKESVTAGTE